MVSCRNEDCSEEFSSEDEMEVHFSKEHDESAKEKSLCVECGEMIEYYPSSKPGKYCSECQKDRPWDNGGAGGRHLYDIPDEYKEKSYDIDEPPEREFNVTTERRGDISEQTVITAFMKRKGSVLEPKTDNEPYDLVIEYENEFVRVQVKTGYFTGIGTISFSSTSIHTNSSGNKRDDYVGDIDIFAVCVPEFNKIFLVTIEESGSSGLRLRYEVPDQPSNEHNWAVDYELDNRWPDIIEEL